MVSVLPFRALSPRPSAVDEVAAPPYDVMSRAEAREMIKDKPNSILRVTRPDAILSDEVSTYDDLAYHTAREELCRLFAEGILVFDTDPCYYIYTQEMGSHRQTGIVGLASAADYFASLIKKHEYTLPKKEDDRTKQVLALGAHLGPVFLTHLPHMGLKEIIAVYQAHPPTTTHIASDGIKHEIWKVSNPTDLNVIQRAYSEIDKLYIADGHHRAAAAARVSKELIENPMAEHFLSVSFAADELLVLPYQRVVTELRMSSERLLSLLKEQFVIEQVEPPQDRDPSEVCHFPKGPQHWGMYLEGQWYIMSLNSVMIREVRSRDLTAQLDVSVLQDEVLRPLLGVEDPRNAEHISFIGGIRGFRELESRVNECGGVAFALYPTSLKELMEIADDDSVMPPKSTWFEPKLRTGLLMSVFDRSKLNV